MNDPDLLLWPRARDGDRAAFRTLFDRHEQRLFRHAVRLLSVREDAKDAVAIAFLELWRKRRTVRLVDGSPLPWLLNTVTNTVRNLERSGRRHRLALSRIDHDPRHAEIAARDESGILGVLATMPVRDQQVLVLSAMQGYTEAEIAAALGVAPGTVKSRLSRAKARLRVAADGLHPLSAEGAVR
ncbi:RNA polymerase sigma factor [Microbacterium sp. BH-3-3-3]|uniref:RNA polymerase sigma factor n=1 Tax=Microbacterium sp. BH-3-3-3 TaxID=1906742 RepID=UPI0011A20A64|nr:RNA polymerase sigma factor [Microbacterium sp. BH-3-3-3]